MSKITNLPGTMALAPSTTSSTLNAPHKRLQPRFRPQCTHLTMTRLYGFEFVCDSCRHHGNFGWVYRCTQDREDVIEEAIDVGRHVRATL